jgi:hypothetical protein
MVVRLWSGKVVEEAIDNVKADIHLPPRCPRIRGV